MKTFQGHLICKRKCSQAGVVFNFIADLIEDSKPSVPPAPKIDLSKVVGDVTAAAKTSLPEATALATSVNKSNLDQLQTILKAAIPGFDNLVGGISGLLGSELKGQIPEDVSQEVMRKSAAKAFQSGIGPTSGVARNLTARDLGLTSFDITQRGLDATSRWLQIARTALTPGLMDVSSFFPSLQQGLGVEEFNQANVFNQQWLKNQIDKLPEGLEKAGVNALRQFDKTITQVGLSLLGSFTGGMGGGGGMGGMFGGGGGGGSSAPPPYLGGINTTPFINNRSSFGSMGGQTYDPWTGYSNFR